MARYVLRRLVLALPTLLGSFVVIFLSIHLIPGDPVEVMLSQHFIFSQDTYETVRHKLGLDRPLYVQFWDQLTRTLSGDLGTSLVNRQPVAQNVAEQFPFTLQLSLATIALTVCLGVPAGVLSALCRNRWPDFVGMFGAIVAVSVPSFWLGVVLLAVFSGYLGWLPAFGTGAPGDPRELLGHLVLPAIALSAASTAFLARVSRSAMLEALQGDFVRTARAKGLPERAVVSRHTLRNALLPVITLLGLEFGTLLGGTVVVETVFSRRGVGRLLLESVLSRDYPQIQGMLLIYTALIVAINLAVDCLYAVVDPRIRYHA